MPWPRAARKLPKADDTSAGSGGKTFSAAAIAARIEVERAEGKRAHPVEERRESHGLTSAGTMLAVASRRGPRRARSSPCLRWTCP